VDELIDNGTSLVSGQIEAGDKAGYLWEQGMFEGFSHRAKI